MERPEDQETQPGGPTAGPDDHAGVPQRRLGHDLRVRPLPRRRSARPGRNEVGYATTVSFPTGVGAKGNSGVTATVDTTPGAIGYIEASYLIAAGLGAAAIQNKAGNFEYPNLKNIEEAAAIGEDVPPSNELTISTRRRRLQKAYPISTFTYAIVPHDAPQKR